ncbi:hypothetical protein LJ656_26845 [Paraburkholderia sp. MMS20-SJTR3]|uniref:OmpA family protein n=1 Tax=Paraburkholderia sejongensis TaxID=2886946 RepID=A0ABS8K228_9BURK|nr:hypothetical protein [Paraburkholderia sp. MMS20-SJTR3]MCC8396212.1 hypothetical protein [Paraburkholderia sp. MMS20-SJTR3]
MKKFFTCFFTFLFANFIQQASACTIFESAITSVPLNYTGIPNSYRMQIAGIVLNARKWPDVEIQAEIIASAATAEKKPRQLAQLRGDEIRDFLIQLGVEAQHIYIDTHVMTEPLPSDSTGPGGYKQLRVSLMPFCKNGCQNLCDDPRITPTSRAIK